MAGALIITAELGPEDFAWLDSLRSQHYPAELNRVPAHLTMFHALPPSSEAEVRHRLAEVARGPRPKAVIDGLVDLGGAVAARVISEDLDRLRDELWSDLHGLFGAQDSGGWRPHVTIQNKVVPKVSRALAQKLEGAFRRRPLVIRGLTLQRYLDGSWEKVAVYRFRL